MDFSRRSDDSFRPRSASRDCGGLRAVPSLIRRWTGTASGNSDEAKTQRLFWARGSGVGAPGAQSVLDSGKPWRSLMTTTSRTSA